MYFVGSVAFSDKTKGSSDLSKRRRREKDTFVAWGWGKFLCSLLKQRAEEGMRKKSKKPFFLSGFFSPRAAARFYL
jgi:hypothetical protein